MSLASPPPRGRHELTWTNKSLRLLAHERGRYEWTDRGDHRVAGVRLLHEVGKVGDQDRGSGPDHLLIRGDDLHALRSLARLPEHAREYARSARLSQARHLARGQAFEHYDDAPESPSGT